jgi:hypothetical protein
VVGSPGEGQCDTVHIGIRHNPQFTDRSGLGNPDHRVNRLDVLRDREESS